MRLSNLMKVLPIISFTASFLTLYFLYPESYEVTWKGRAYYIFFLWLVLLELILNWRRIDIKVHKVKSKHFLMLAAAAFSPIIYVLFASLSGLNAVIIGFFPKHYGMSIWAESMPLTVEYVVLAALFLLMTALAYEISGLRYFMLPISLLWVIGLVFLVDNLYPYGEFTPFQMFVPTTAMLASNILSSMGYKTELIGQSYGITVLRVCSNGNEVSFGIAWPCSGIDSLIIYSVVTALFLEDSVFSRKWKVALFLAGMIITYFINALRIAIIFIIAIEHGISSLEVQRFHSYYGPLYSIIWIIIYQLIIVIAQLLWGRKPKDGAPKSL